jgi:hypothetical protein
MAIVRFSQTLPRLGPRLAKEERDPGVRGWDHPSFALGSLLFPYRWGGCGLRDSPDIDELGDVEAPGNYLRMGGWGRIPLPAHSFLENAGLMMENKKARRRSPELPPRKRYGAL